MAIGVPASHCRAAGRCRYCIESCEERRASQHHDSVGMSPLLWAVFGGYFEIVRILLNNGGSELCPRRSIAHSGTQWVTSVWSRLPAQFGEMGPLRRVIRSHRT